MIIFAAKVFLDELRTMRTEAGRGRTSGAEAKTRDLRGMRYQIYKALSQLDKGAAMLVEWKIRDLREHLRDEKVRLAFFEEINNDKAWKSAPHENLRVSFIAGTSHAASIGSVLIRNGWAVPKTDGAHWVPNAWHYEITESGRESLMQGTKWFNSLSPLQKLLAPIAE